MPRRARLRRLRRVTPIRHWRCPDPARGCPIRTNAAAGRIETWRADSSSTDGGLRPQSFPCPQYDPLKRMASGVENPGVPADFFDHREAQLGEHLDETGLIGQPPGN